MTVRRGDIVLTGAWAGWRITSARYVMWSVGIRPDGRVGTIPAEPGQYRCQVEDPGNLRCTGSGIIFTPNQVRRP